MITESDILLQRRLLGAAMEYTDARDALALLPDEWWTDHASRLARQILVEKRPQSKMAFGTIVISNPHLRAQFGDGTILPDFDGTGIHTSSLDWHIEQLRQAFIRHSVECFTDHVQHASSPSIEGEERINILETAINDIRQKSRAGLSSYAHIRQGVAAAIEEIQAAQSAIQAGERTRTIPTGIENLDALLFGGGFHPGQIVFIGARPGVGKSSMMINCARNQAKEGWKVGIVSLEMTRRQLAEIGAQICSDMSFQRFYRQAMTQDDLNKAIAGLTDIGGCEIYVDDSSALTADQVAARIAHMARVEGCQIVYVDYAQKITKTGKKDIVQELAHISARLTQSAKELDIAVVSLAQLNRDAANAAPRLENIKGCSDFEQDAHIALLLHRPEQNNQSIDVETMEIHVAKQRRGIASGFVTAKFDRHTQRIF